MTRYTVIWSPSALDDLADLWTSAPDRNAVTAAAQLVDDELAQDASTKGKDVAEGLRALIAAPLRAYYSVDDGDRTVEVTRVVHS
jgi:plasmid stabilization system protein ParE